MATSNREMEMLADQMQELIKQAREDKAERDAAKFAEAQLKVLTVTFDKAAAYTNLIVVGGYAGFFGLWQLTKDYLTRPQALWAASLALASLAAFVLFEVAKMVTVQRRVIKQSTILMAPGVQQSQVSYVEALKKLEEAHDFQSKWDLYSWAATLIFTVATGLSAAGVLAYSFVTGLATEQPASEKAPSISASGPSR